MLSSTKGLPDHYIIDFKIDYCFFIAGALQWYDVQYQIYLQKNSWQIKSMDQIQKDENETSR